MAISAGCSAVEGAASNLKKELASEGLRDHPRGNPAVGSHWLKVYVCVALAAFINSLFVNMDELVMDKMFQKNL